MNITNIASRICNTCTSDCFDCPRKDWNKNKISTGVVSSEECPIMQFDAKEDKDKRPWHERLRDGTLPKPVTRDDTLLVCEQCKYSEVDGTSISLDKHFFDICVNCPNFQIRDSLEESEAEASCS